MESEATTSAMLQEDGYREYAVAPKRKRNKTSKVWKELRESRNAEGERIATCKHCDLILTAQPESGTSHLKRHLERCPKRPTGPEIGDLGSDDGGDFTFDMSELRKEIVSYIVEGAHSFSTVEEKGFRKMMLKATPHFVPFSRATAKRELLSLYASERDRVKDMLLKAPGRISLTTDNWKSPHTWQHYICITAHFVDSAWKLQKRILRFRALVPPYNGESIANEVYLFLTQWGIADKVLSISVDNASYNDTMISNLRSMLIPRGGLYTIDSIFHVRCCAHILNLVVQDGLDSIKDILEKIRSLVKLIIQSSRRSKEFNECVKKFHLDGKRKLALDMQVRWNSTYKMLENVLYYKDVLVSMGSMNSNMKIFIPSGIEWGKVVAIHKFLKLFYDVTCMFSGVKYPTSNLYFKGAWTIQRRLLQTASSPHDFMREMVKPMINKFDKYWSEYNLYLSCAAILDPRFKVKMIEYCFCKLFGEDEALQRVDVILSYLHSLYEEYKLHSSASPMVVPPPSSSEFGDEDSFEDYGSFSGRSLGTQAAAGSSRSQLDLYLQEPALDLNMELDVLDFWHKSALRYPCLSVMAQDLLTIPVSTVASESAFSLGGKTISPARSSLKPKTVQALVCLQDWRCAEGDIPIHFDFDTSSCDEAEDEAEDEADDEDDEDDTALYS